MFIVTPKTTVNPHIFLLRGQSNARGSDNIRNLTNNNRRKSIAFGRVFHDVTNSFMPLQAGVSGHDVFPFFGPDVGFAKKYHELTNVQCWVIKYAIGGKHLANDDLSNSYYPIGGGQYTNMQSTVANAMNWLSQRGISAKIKGTIFWQGESDSNIEARANAYQDNLELYINTERKWLYDNDYTDNLNIPAVVTQIYTENGYTYLNTVRTAQGSMPNILDNCGVVDGNGIISLLDDDIHANADSSFDMGEAFAEKIVSLL